MRITLTKRADGSVVLRCVRDDGTATWQRQEGPHARFFPLHDLAHHAVETTLGTRDGFFGLVAAGWDIDDTDGKGARGPLPYDAIRVENLVGMLDAQRASVAAGGAWWNAGDVNAQAAAYFTNAGHPAPPPLDDATLDAIHARVAELHARWYGLSPGASLELEF